MSIKKRSKTRTPKTSRWISTRSVYEWRDNKYVKVEDEGYWYDGPLALASDPPSFTITYWRFQNEGAENNTNYVANENANPSKGDIAYDTTYFFRCDVEETSSNKGFNQTFQLQYRVNTGGGYGSWSNVDGSSSYVRSVTSVSLTDDGTASQLLSGGYSYLTPNDGVENDGNGLVGGSEHDLQSNGVENCFPFQIRSADLSEDDTIELRMIDSAGYPGDVASEPTWPTITAPAAATPRNVSCTLTTRTRVSYDATVQADRNVSCSTVSRTRQGGEGYLELSIPAANNHDFWTNLDCGGGTIGVCVPHVLQDIGTLGDFSVTAKWNNPPVASDNRKLGGIIVAASGSGPPGDYIRFDVYSDGATLRWLARYVSDQDTETENLNGGTGTTSTVPYYVRMTYTHSGATYLWEWSDDGSSWQNFGSADALDAHSSFVPARVGLWSGNYNTTEANAPAFDSQFDWFHVTGSTSLSNDEFNSGSLDTGVWTAFNPAGDCTISVQGGGGSADVTTTREVNPASLDRTRVTYNATVETTGGLSVSADSLYRTRVSYDAEVNASRDVDADSLDRTRVSYDAQVDTDRSVSADSLDRTRVTYDASIQTDNDVSAGTLQRTRAIYAADVNAEQSVSAASLDRTRTLYDATVNADRTVDATDTDRTRVIYDATVQAKEDRNVSCDTANRTRVSYDASVLTDNDVSTGSLDRTRVTYDATVETDRQSNATSLSRTRTLYDATVAADNDVNVTETDRTKVIYAATVDTTTNRNVAADTLSRTRVLNDADVNASRDIAASETDRTRLTYQASVDGSRDVDGTETTRTRAAYDATVSTDRSVDATQTNRTRAIESATITLGQNQDVSAGAVTRTRSIYDATVAADKEISATSVARTRTGYNATVSASRGISADSLVRTRTTYNASVTTARQVSASSLARTRVINSVTVETDQSIVCTLLTRTRVIYGATVEKGGAREVSGSSASRTRSIPSATVQTGAAREVSCTTLVRTRSIYSSPAIVTKSFLNPFTESTAIIEALRVIDRPRNVAEAVYRVRYALKEVIDIYEDRISDLEARVTEHESKYP